MILKTDVPKTYDAKNALLPDSWLTKQNNPTVSNTAAQVKIPIAGGKGYVHQLNDRLISMIADNMFVETVFGIGFNPIHQRQMQKEMMHPDPGTMHWTFRMKMESYQMLLHRTLL